MESVGPPFLVSLFYLYTPIEKPCEIVESQRALLKRLGVYGRVRIACEGINATVCGRPKNVESYHDALETLFVVPVDFKVSTSMTQCFPDLQVRVTSEIVTLGISPKELSYVECGTHVSPQEFKQRLGTLTSNSIVLDVRNKYESDIGHFVTPNTILPPMRQFSDFPLWLERNRNTLAVANEIFLYCTGGIRCERASALVSRQLGLEKDRVFQLRGGICRYLDEFADGGGLWSGKNLVFDDRLAVQRARGIVGACVVCGSPHDDYAPNFRCQYCRCRLLVCPKCNAPAFCGVCQKKYDDGDPRVCKRAGLLSFGTSSQS